MSEAGNRSHSRGVHDGGLSLRQFYRNEYQNSFISSLRNVNDAWKGEGKEESALVRGGKHEEEDS